MPRLKTGLSIGVMVALAIAIWAALASGDSDPEPTTTTTTTTLPTSTTTAPTTTTTTSTTTPPQTSVPDTTVDAEARREEVRLILEDLYFRWFDAIYHNDEEAVREVVALEAGLDAFRSAVVALEFQREPEPGDVLITAIEVLRDDERCLVTHSTLDVQQLQGSGAIREGVDVMYAKGDGWRLATQWINPTDMWEADCEAERVGELP